MPEPSAVQVHCQRARELSAVGRGRDAVLEARRAVGVDPNDPSALHVHAQVSVVHGAEIDPEGQGLAERDLATRAYLDRCPQDSSAHLFRALHLVQTARTLPGGVRRTPDTNVVDVPAAKEAVADAWEHARYALELRPDSEWAHRVAAIVRRAAGRYAEAEALVERGLGIAPESAASHRLLARIHLDRCDNMMSRAARSLFVAALYTLGLTLWLAVPAWITGRLLARKRGRRALAAAAEAVRLEPDHPDSLQVLADAQSQAFRVRETADALVASVAADPVFALQRQIPRRLRSLWGTRAAVVMFGLWFCTVPVVLLFSHPGQAIAGAVAGLLGWGAVVDLARLRASLDTVMPRAAVGAADASPSPLAWTAVYVTLVGVFTVTSGPSDEVGAGWFWFGVVQAPAVAVGAGLLVRRYRRARAAGSQPEIDELADPRGHSVLVVHWLAALAVGWLLALGWLEGFGSVFLYPVVAVATLWALRAVSRYVLDGAPLRRSTLAPFLTWGVLTLVGLSDDGERSVEAIRAGVAGAVVLLVVGVGCVDRIWPGTWLPRTPTSRPADGVR